MGTVPILLESVLAGVLLFDVVLVGPVGPVVPEVIWGPSLEPSASSEPLPQGSKKGTPSSHLSEGAGRTEAILNKLWKCWRLARPLI